MTHFDEPIIKKVSDLQKGDVFRCEFGDFDNLITAVCESSYPYDKKANVVSFHYPKGYENVGTLEMVANIDDTVEVIGKE